MRYLLTSVLLLLAISAGAQTKDSATKRSAKVIYGDPQGIDAAVIPGTAKNKPPVQKPEDHVYVYVTQMPQPGYDLNNYFTKNMRYPALAKKNNIQGKVNVNFIINEDGSIGECMLFKGLDSECDEEAIRLIKNMPRWKPGKQDGKAVKVRYNQPVIFKL